MLTDTFHERYADRPIWTGFTAADGRLNVKLFRVIKEQLFPPFDSKGATHETNLTHWKQLDRKLSMELGRKNLAQTWAGAGTSFYTLTAAQICENFMCAPFDPNVDDADEFMKQRVSFVELALREKADENAYKSTDAYEKFGDLLAFGRSGGIRVPGDPEAGRRARMKARDEVLEGAIEEINARFAAARKPLNYHNGLVQISTDETIEKTVEQPFWQLVADPKWANVDTDIKEAMDRRDNGGRDPALYAAKALESVIKILSTDLGANTGKENGAHAFIDNLISERSGRFVEAWEGVQLKSFFTSVRNPLGHGPGGEPMPVLTPSQTDWAIEFVMIWTKSLIGRIIANR